LSPKRATFVSPDILNAMETILYVINRMLRITFIEKK
jgi:hypothetical protein